MRKIDEIYEALIKESLAAVSELGTEPDPTPVRVAVAKRADPRWSAFEVEAALNLRGRSVVLDASAKEPWWQRLDRQLEAGWVEVLS